MINGLMACLSLKRLQKYDGQTWKLIIKHLTSNFHFNGQVAIVDDSCARGCVFKSSHHMPDGLMIFFLNEQFKPWIVYKDLWLDVKKPAKSIICLVDEKIPSKVCIHLKNLKLDFWTCYAKSLSNVCCFTEYAICFDVWNFQLANLVSA